MIIKIGSAIIDGAWVDESNNSPVQEIETSEGMIIVMRPNRNRGLRQQLTVNTCQQESVILLNSYANLQTPVSVSFINEDGTTAKSSGNIIIEKVELAPLDAQAMSMLRLNTLNGILVESVYSGSLGVITC